MTRPTNSDALAELLKDHPPPLDDVGKARMEKRLLEAARSRVSARSAALQPVAPPGRRGGVVWLGGGLAIAAAALLGFFALQPDSPTDAPRAQFETYDDTTRQRGTLEVGSTLRTDAQSEGDIGIADSRVHIEPSTVLYLGALSAENIALELTRGQIRVEFHPEVRGEEHLSIRTPHAVVEVVGTVFAVRVTEDSTEVSVTEGQVRVVETGGEQHMVGAHDAVTVRRGTESGASEIGETASVDPTPAEPTSAASAPGSAEVEQTGTQTERARRLATPAQRVARARAHMRRNEPERAIAILEEVTSAADASPNIRAHAYTLLGDLLRQANRNQEARSAYEGAIRQRAGSLSHSAIYALGRLQERRMNDPAAARASYRRYLDEAPQGPLAGQIRERLCRLGDTTVCPGAQ